MGKYTQYIDGFLNSELGTLKTPEQLYKFSLTKKIYQYDLDGNFIQSFNKVTEAERTTGIRIRKTGLTSGGFIWKYEFYNKLPQDVLLSHQHPKDGKPKEVNQYDMDGNFIKTYPSVNQAERETGVLNQNIWKNVKNKAKSAGGFTWKLQNS
jgi:hypothetical protein